MATSLPALAQERSADARLEEIVVTARSRDEDLFQAPLSITSLSSGDLERTNIQDIATLSQFSPGFYYTPQVTFSSSRVAPAYRFRGMNNGSNDPLQQLGGTFIDGVYLFGGAQSLTMDDIERVEVIKGPQSALFGRGTFAGAINFITREPSDTFKARVSAGVETRDSRQAAASIEGRLVEYVTFRLSGSTLRKGAHFKANDGGDLGREETHTLNGQFVFKPSDAFRLRVRHSQVWQNDSKNGIVNMNASRPELANAEGRCVRGTQPYWCGAVPDLDSSGVPASIISVATNLVPPAFADSNRPTTILDILNDNRANPLVVRTLPYLNKTPKLDHAGLAGRFVRTSAEANYTFDNEIAIDAVVARSEMRTTTAQSTSNDRGNAWVISPNILRDSSGDIRVSSSQRKRLTWLFGANAFRQTSLGGANGTGAIPSVHDNTRLVSYNAPVTFTGQGRLESWSVFGALGFKVNDDLSLDAEGRYVTDKVTTSLNLPTQTTSTFKNFTPRVILTYEPGEVTTIYASWARGSLPGTTNSNTTLLSPALQAQIRAFPGYSVDVPDEQVNNYELGLKQRFGWLRYAVTGYHMKWENLKNVVNLPCPGNVCGPTVPAAFAPTTFGQSAKIWGVEGEIDALLAKGWNTSISFSVNDAKYSRFFAPLAAAATGQTDASGKTIYGFPSIQGVFSTGYTAPLSGKLDGFINTDLTYTGKIYVDEVNQSWIEPWVKWNLRMGVQTEAFRVEAYAENLLNEKTWLSGIRSTQSVYSIGTTTVSQATATVVLPRLRTFGVRFSYNFQ